MGQIWSKLKVSQSLSEAYFNLNICLFHFYPRDAQHRKKKKKKAQTWKTGPLQIIAPPSSQSLSSSFLHSLQFSSVQFSHSVMSNSLRPHEPEHTRLPCTSPTPGVYPNSCPLIWWCHLTISSSVIPFSSCPQSFPTSGSFQVSQLSASCGQNTGVSSSTSVLPMNTQGWSPLGWAGWISLQSKGLSRVFSNTTVQKHQFFGAQLSLYSNSHIHTWPLEKL